MALWRDLSLQLHKIYDTVKFRKEEMMNLEQLDNVSGGRIGKPWVPPGSRDLINPL